MQIRKLDIENDYEWIEQLRIIGADKDVFQRLAQKNKILTFLLKPIISPAANILKQCMLANGADAIVARDAVSCSTDETAVLIVGTYRQLIRVCISLRGQPFGLAAFADEFKQTLDNPLRIPDSIVIGRKVLDFTHSPLIMGILNVTPDSFSDGGRFADPTIAVRHTEEMSKAGATIIDIGAESTRPGSRPVSAEEQIERLMPVVSALYKNYSAVVSVDTSSAEVAEKMLLAGADMINDTMALKDPRMSDVCAEAKCPIVLMHMQGTPESMQNNPEYNDVVDEIYDYLLEKIELAVAAGIKKERILIDPGIGFGKQVKDNISLISRIAEFKELGCPVILGHSRKSFLGHITGIEDPEKREAVTHAVTAMYGSSADIVRVHDVAGTKDVLQVLRAFRNGGK